MTEVKVIVTGPEKAYDTRPSSAGNEQIGEHRPA